MPKKPEPAGELAHKEKRRKANEEELEEAAEEDEAAQRAAKKAARQAAKKKAAEAEEAVVEGTAEESERKALKRAAKQAALPAAASAEVAGDDEVTAADAERKAQRRAAKRALAAESAETSNAAAEEAEKAERKARKRAAKEALAEKSPEVDEVPDESAEKAARKAQKKAAKAQQELESDLKKRTKNKEAYKEEQEEEQPQESKNKKRRTEIEEALVDETPTQQKTDDGKELGVAAFREKHEILVKSECPAPFETFKAAVPSLGNVLVSALTAQGYSSPTPIQAQAWPIALQGKDLVAVAKTGSGKTCGFLLPVLARIAERGPAPAPRKISFYQSEPARPSALMLAPTRELAQQIAGEAEKFAHFVKARVVAIYGGVPKGDQVRELKRGCDVLIATPGRLIDLATGDDSRNIRPSVTCEVVNYLVLDEADRMLDMGFEPDIRKVVGWCQPTGKPEEAGGASGPSAGSKRQTLFFTATWPKSVQSTASSLTSADAVQVRIGQGGDGDQLTANKNVTQVVNVLREAEKLEKLKGLIKDELGSGETCIVFAAQKHSCDDLVYELQRAGLGIWCRTIHSGKDQWDRDESLARFRALTDAGISGKGEKGVLVATDVASRGLDIPGVAMVVIYNFGRALHSGQNGGVESYVHRIGRTGRANRKGRAFTLFTSEDQGACELIELLEGAKQEVPQALRDMAAREYDERWVKDSKKSWYRGGRGRGKGGGKGGGKSGGKGGGKSRGRGRGF